MIFDDRGIAAFDVSKWQALYDQATDRWTYINWDVMRESGISFVVIKLGQHNYTDFTFEYNWANAKRVGIPRAAYWFLDWRSSPQVQARMFWTNLVKDPGEGPLVVDYEAGSSGQWEDLYDFIVELQRLSGYSNDRIWIYTGYYYWIEHSPASISQREWFAKYPLWLAWYTANPAEVQIPDMWSKCVLWQQGTPTIGKQVGAHSKEIDYNVFNGDRVELAKYFTKIISAPLPPPPQEGDAMYRGTVKSTAVPFLNLREQASVTARDIGNLYPGDVVDADTLFNGWLRIVRVNGQPIVGFASAAYIEYPEVTVPDPIPDPVVKSPFTFKLKGFKEFKGELEKE